MPKRMVDGDRIWTSEKLRSVEPPEWRFHYANLLPLALANGSFECDPVRVQRDVYFYLRPEIDLEIVKTLLKEYERVKLLFRWYDAAGKVWGFWVGIKSEGLLPAQAHVKRGDYKKGPEPPPDLLERFLSGEIESGLTPGGEPVAPLLTPEEPPARLGKVRLGLVGVGEDNTQNFSDDGQEIGMKLKDELTKIAVHYGAKAGGYKTTWDQIKSLGVAHGTGAVSTDFSAFMEEYQGDDFPSGAVVSYLRVAEDRLVSNSAPALAISRDPEIKNLTREIIFLSDGKATPQGRHKVQMADLLAEYSLDEVISAFKGFIADKDLDDSYIQKYIIQNFLDAADGLCSMARRKKQEAEETKALRDQTAARLQEQAEQERLAKAQQEKLVGDFDLWSE